MPPLARLALAYAPARLRADWLAVLALDARLAKVVRQAREPMLAQIRLAWWRERLAADPAGWPRGEPVLAALAAWGEAAPRLVPLVDGWEALLGDPPLAGDSHALFADGRGVAMGALAARAEVDPARAEAAGRQWA
ncbi:MAG TPA: squalene/phytoene synthase family protein, partial [Novosphingobium sp.]